MNNVFQSKYVVLGTLLSLVLIFFMGRSFGKSEPPAAINIEGQTDTDGYLVSSLDEIDIRTLTEQVYNDLDGVNWTFGLSGRDNQVWYRLSALSDRDLVRVINEWSKTYYKKHSEKLSEAILSDYFYDIASLVQTVRLRIEKLEKYN
jgi:hypothetical protein